jgi:general secretion pathway protein K
MRRLRPDLPRRQRGVALITALLVVALATAAAVAMVSRQQLDIRRSSNLLAADQALLYAEGAEDWAAQMLRRDRDKGGKTDNLGEDWATVLPPISVEGGQIAGGLEDLQGRFNLNNLMRGKSVSEVDLKRFQRLLAAVGLTPELANAVLDWMDADGEVRFPGGAEDDTYSRLDPPYRTANRPFADRSELRLVAGFDAKAYAALAPLVTALPEPTPINVNTAPASVLMALADGLTKADAQALVDARGENGFGSVDEFLQQNVLAGRDVATQGISVASRYFLVRSNIEVGDLQTEFYSILARDDSGTGIPVRRGRGEY